jgi:hypothetical protein
MFLLNFVTMRDKWILRFLAFNGERCFYLCLILGVLELAMLSSLNLRYWDVSSLPAILSLVVSAVTFLMMMVLPVILFKICNNYVNVLW